MKTLAAIALGLVSLGILVSGQVPAGFTSKLVDLANYVETHGEQIALAPQLSTTLGVTRNNDSLPVRQVWFVTGKVVHTANFTRFRGRADIILFYRTNDEGTAYLTGRTGVLESALHFDNRAGTNVNLNLDAARSDYEREMALWFDQLRNPVNLNPSSGTQPSVQAPPPAGFTSKLLDLANYVETHGAEGDLAGPLSTALGVTKEDQSFHVRQLYFEAGRQLHTINFSRVRGRADIIIFYRTDDEGTLYLTSRTGVLESAIHFSTANGFTKLNLDTSTSDYEREMNTWFSRLPTLATESKP